MQESNQEKNSFQTEEINLLNLVNSFYARKLFIFIVTTFVTLVAIVYALNITPTYKSTSSFISPSDSSVITVNNKMELANETKESIFNTFLTQLTSRELQKQIFIDRGYLSELAPNLKNNTEIDIYISNFVNSISLSPPHLTERDLTLTGMSDRALGYSFLTEKPYEVSIEGSNPIIISTYLNELVAAANSKAVSELKNLIKHKINMRLDQIAKERQLLLIEEKQQRLNEIQELIDAARIAKSLGIIDNNLNIIASEQASTNLIVSIGGEQTGTGLPDWYLYGEKALLERVKALQKRTNDAPFIPELVDLDIEKLRLKSNFVEGFDFNSMQINQVAITPANPIKPKKRQIVLLAFIGGLMLSIFLILFMNALKANK